MPYYFCRKPHPYLFSGIGFSILLQKKQKQQTTNNNNNDKKLS